MQKKIKEMEKRSLDPKSWQMSGEVAAIRRPENSLMQEHLDFDHTSRPGNLLLSYQTIFIYFM